MPVDRVLGGLALTLALAVGHSAWRFGVGTPHAPGSGFWPFLVSLAIAGLGAWLALSPGHKRRTSEGPAPRWRNLWIALASMLFFVLALVPLGYPLVMTLLLLIQFRWVEGRSWRTALLVSILAAVVSFVAFRVLLKVPLPAGLLPLPRGW